MSDRPVFHTLALDCPDPRTLAAFYADLLGYAVSTDSNDEWVTITGPGPQMSFQLAPDHVPPTWPNNDVPQQAHVDFCVTDIAAAHQRVLTLGGGAIDPVEPPATRREPALEVPTARIRRRRPSPTSNRSRIQVLSKLIDKALVQ